MRAASGARASAYARVCAWKSRLLGRLEATSLLVAADAASMQRAIAALGIEHRFERLMGVYRMVLRAYPDGAPLLRSLLRLHEIENLKLLWRAIIRRRNHGSLQRLWLPLGGLASIPLETLRVTTLRDLTQQLATTPFGPIAADVARAFGDDLGAAELAFDRWASLQLLEQARRLPRTESLARRLVELVLLERDSEILRRGQRWFGLSEAAARASVADRLFSAATPADAALLRSQRLRLCRRAFIGDPFALAPAVALVLLAEEELRGVRALIERAGDASLDAVAARAMAGAEFAP